MISLKLAQNHVFKGVWDDLEAGIGISMKKRVLDMGSNYFFDGFEIFRIFTLLLLREHIKLRLSQDLVTYKNMYKKNDARTRTCAQSKI